MTEATSLPQSDALIWMIILAMGIGTFAVRFSFMGLLGGVDLPPWVLRYLRYTSVAVIPALIAPLVAWPAATQGQTDPPRLIAALVALMVGYWSKNVLVTMVCAIAVLLLAQAALT
ncbi:AzlD domain-containing protein [Alphaproteobacteria bacterium KMM 3653]|uniref:AzlD domain-containing protein n=1 Tax=Harenicola maris TaxID=2841044 RepID=A0AAP2G485_9RHOB|nr:AzlD domain-containing protein [Harenicola maris]